MFKFSKIFKPKELQRYWTFVRFQFNNRGSDIGQGGSVRQAGGGKNEAAREEEYFNRKQSELIEKLRHEKDENTEDNENKANDKESKEPTDFGVNFDPESYSIREFCVKKRENNKEEEFFHHHQIDIANDLKMKNELNKNQDGVFLTEFIQEKPNEEK